MLLSELFFLIMFSVYLLCCWDCDLVFGDFFGCAFFLGYF